jgi:hypothetical protein
LSHLCSHLWLHIALRFSILAMQRQRQDEGDDQAVRA